MPRASVKRVETMDQPVGQGAARPMKSTGPAQEALAPPSYEASERETDIIIPANRVRIDSEKTAKLAFDQELVTIHVHTTTDPTAPQKFELGVNGHMVVLERGKSYTLKRYLVEKLMRCKETTFRMEEGISADGVREYKYIPQDALRFGFSITKDDHPRSADWQRAILAEPN
ncbi:MAG: hypothetical protein ACM3SS_11550 [Rhodospirillaceae bacterium]